MISEAGCQLQELCIKYNNGTNKPPNHHVRLTVPCNKWLACDCEMWGYWSNWQGEVIACSIKHKVISEG